MTGIEVVRDRVVFPPAIFILILVFIFIFVMVAVVNGGNNVNVNAQVGLRAALVDRAVCADMGTHKDAANNTPAILSACMRGKLQIMRISFLPL